MNKSLNLACLTDSSTSRGILSYQLLPGIIRVTKLDVSVLYSWYL